MDKVEALRVKLQELKSIFESKDYWTSEELSEYHISCLTLFDSLGVRESLVKDFSVFFNSHLISDGESSSLFRLVSDQDTRLYIWRQSLHILTIHSVFLAAEKRIDLLEDELSIVPRFIIEHFKKEDPNGHIYSSLTAIDTSSKEKDTDKLITSANSLLDSLLSDFPELAEKRDLGPKLLFLLANPKIAEQYGMSKEMVIALNNSRVIRNVDLIHPKAGASTIPLIVAQSYAYLVVFLLKSLLAAEKVSKKDKISL